MLSDLIAAIQELIRKLNSPSPPPVKSNRERLYETAVASLGRDASPKDVAPDNLACVETLCEILRAAFPTWNVPIILGTREMYSFLRTNPTRFAEVYSPQPGDIIITVTGTGNGTIAHGHCGVTSKYGILTNDSRSGLFLENYTLGSWKLYFERKGGFITHYFRVLG